MTKARQLADLISSGSIETAEITSLDAAKLTGNIADARVPASAVTQHANNYTHPNHSGEVTSTADGATVIANTAITGQTAITSLADTDKFLVSDASDSGNLKYVEKQYLGGGGLIFIGEVSATSEVTNLVLDNVFTSSYTNYLLVGEYTLANGSSPSARFKFRTGGSSGSDLSSSEYNYHFALGKADVGTYNSTRATGAASCEFTADTSNNQARVGIRLTWTVYDPFDNGKRTSISGHGKYTQSDGNSAATVGSCDYRTNDSVTGIKFYASNDNVYSGHFRVYGIVDS